MDSKSGSKSETPGRPRVLCVDDEPYVLEGMSTNLRRDYEIVTALSGAAGLEVLRTEAPFAVVLSDMRMPGMDGAAFLAQVRKLAPDAVRMLLTGQAEISAAVAAINEGQIFRFLCKPCPLPALKAALAAALEQHRLITSEKVLLEQTLHGAVRALTDILGLVSPMIFGHATRVRQHAVRLAEHMQVPERWQVEVAAMLAQVGYVTLPAQVVERLLFDKPLAKHELALIDRLPHVVEQILGQIPRLEAVREIIVAQGRRFGDGQPPIPLGARVLRVANDYERLEAQRLLPAAAVETLRNRAGLYDPEVLDALAVVLRESAGAMKVEDIRLEDLRPGMTLADDLRNTAGTLLIPRGYEVTPSLQERVRNFAPDVLRLLVRVAVRRG